MKEIKIYEFFSGMGSQLKALKNIATSNDICVKSVGACEWYINAIIAYLKIHYGELKPETELTKEQMIEILKNYSFSANSKTLVSETYFTRNRKLSEIFPYLYAFVNNDYFNKVYKTNKEFENYTDITKVDSLKSEIDILTYSFPCQDISSQGLKRGITKETRSGLLYEIERIIKNSTKRPKILLLENVKNLVSKKFINDFKKWIEVLDELGYETSFKVLNASDFGSAQNRERVFAVSVLRENNHTFDFDSLIKLNDKKLYEIVKTENSGVDLSYILEKCKVSKITTSRNGLRKANLLNYSNFNSENRIYLNTAKVGPTLIASNRLKFYFPEINKLRYINSKEAFLYMGFSENDYEKVKKQNLISETRLTFLCGNSISVEVLESIFSGIINYIKEKND
uniref:Cytosine-specific methyltransferase n=1 Tax=Mycoplasma anserisalpingitidis TaxID=519450 RepID=A0A8F2E4M8_9MOLU|nr:C-5 cytosine-specific DNA methylase [Mycoplasma anserisalpingitidis]